MKILIIDDNLADRNFYKKCIAECGLFSNVQVEECGTLSEAFKHFSSTTFDVIILDLGLPESEGLQTVKNTIDELKKNNCPTPIIVLTGTDDHLIGKEAFKYGVKDFLIKGEVEKNEKELSRSITYATYHLNFSK